MKQTQQQFVNQLNRQSVVSNVKSIKSKEDERKGRRDESQDEGVAVPKPQRRTCKCLKSRTMVNVVVIINWQIGKTQAVATRDGTLHGDSEAVTEPFTDKFVAWRRPASGGDRK